MNFRQWIAGALLGGVLSVPFVASLNAPVTAAPAKKTAPPVAPLTAAALKKQIAARKGKVVLVNLWATWCIGCVEEFPDLVKLQKKYASRGLSVVWVSADTKSAINPQVRPFLASKGVTVPSYLMSEGLPKFASGFEPTNTGAFGLPRTYLYNRQGKQVKVFTTTGSFAEFEKMVKPLL